MREIFYKWLLFVLLAAFMPIVFAAPFLGPYPSAYFLLVIQSIAFLPTSLAPLILLNVVIYAILLYLLAKYLARYCLMSSNNQARLVLLLLLAANLALALTTPIYGSEYNASMLELYLEIFAAG